jgi:hypothetical protein
MAFAEGFQKRLKLANERAAVEMAELMTSQGLFILIVIGGVVHDGCKVRGLADIHVASPEGMEADGWDQLEWLHHAIDCVAPDNEHVTLANDHQERHPPRQTPRARE